MNNKIIYYLYRTDATSLIIQLYTNAKFKKNIKFKNT
jgi:hypothetical protein